MGSGRLHKEDTDYLHLGTYEGFSLELFVYVAGEIIRCSALP